MEEDSVEEFFTDDTFTDSKWGNCPASIQRYLEGKATVQETIQSINTTVGTGEVSLSDIIEECIVHAIDLLAETIVDPLVELVMKLRSEQQQISEHAVTDLDESVAYSLSERWYCYGDPDPYYSFKEEARAAWVNLNRFAALLFSAGIKKLCHFGEQTLQSTLKRGSWWVSWKDSPNTSNSVIALEGHAVAAANWIIICGRQLYDESNVIRIEFPTLKGNLDWILEMDDLNEEIKSKLQEARAIMGTIA